jgi:hypothetical protein
MIALLGLAALAIADPTLQDFDNPGSPFAITNVPSPNPGPGPVVMGPDANSDGLFQRFLRVARHMNSVAFDRTEGGAANRIMAEFDFRITCAGARIGFSGGGCADGFSFMFLDTATFGISGPGPLIEEFAVTRDPDSPLTAIPNNSFGVGFLVFDPGFGTFPRNMVFLRYNNVGIAAVRIDLNELDLATGTFGNPGVFLKAFVDLIIEPFPAVTVTITNPATGVTVRPFLDFDLSGVAGLGPYESRAFYGGRCGDACSLIDIDNIDVQYTPAAPVNTPPVAADDAAVTDEDTAVTIDALANDADADGDSLTVTAVGAPAHGTVVDHGDGTFTYTPEPNFNGDDAFTYDIADGNGGVDSATVRVTVNPVNDAPVAVDDAAVTSAGNPVNIDVLANDSDVDGDVLEVVAVSQPTAGSAGINPDGSIVYTPIGIDDLMAALQGLGSLNAGQRNSLLVKLENAKRSLGRGNREAAAGQLRAFINEIEALQRSGRIDATTAAQLIGLAQAILSPPAADSFTYVVSDGNGGSASAIVHVTINP